MYTDSVYVYGVCHVHGNIWKQRGFLRADGTKVLHGEAVSKLIEAMHLPKALAIIKCPAHQKTDSLVAKDYNIAQDCEPFTTLFPPILVQDRADVEGKSIFCLKRGTIKIMQVSPQKGLRRSAHGHQVLPITLLWFTNSALPPLSPSPCASLCQFVVVGLSQIFRRLVSSVFSQFFQFFQFSLSCLF